ncbi:MAG TPA: AI-2E family transporter, partial [Candidatus Caenarcaniphilales bacterium]
MHPIFSPLQRLLITWLLILLTGWATLKALNYFSELISVFITAGLVAFLLNYPVNKLHRFLPRSIAAALVYLLVGLGVAVLGLTVLPPVLNQARQLNVNLPSLLASGQQQLIAFQTWSKSHNLPFDVQLVAQQLSVRLQDQVQALTAQSWGLVLGTVNWLLDFVLIVVISFYMLVDGERVWRGVISIFSVPVRDQLSEALQRNLQRFFSGQLLLGLFMTLTL